MKELKRLIPLGLAAATSGIIAVLLTVSHAPSANGLPSALVPLAKHLRSGYDIYLRPLPAAFTPQVSRSAAGATASHAFGRGLAANVSAFAASATDKEVTRRQPDGMMRRTMSNRPVWVVLLPNFSMLGYHGMTLCVFVDANTGKYLSAVTVPPVRADRARARTAARAA